MIDYEKTLKELKIDTNKLKPGSGVRVYWRCDKCGKERLKQYRDCIAGSGLCFTCNGIKNATMMGEKFGKKQKMHGKCLYCDTLIRSQNITCSLHNKMHLTKIRSGSNNPAWTGKHVCECGKKKSHGAKQCRTCSFESGNRSGLNNGRWVEDRGMITAAKLARRALSNTFDSLGIKKNGKTLILLKYSFKDLKIHLENQFESWMNWTNRGNKKDQWSLDHIIPVTVLIKHGISDPSIINALWNLRPLRASDNIKRSNKIDADAINLAKEKLNLELQNSFSLEELEKLL